MESWLFILFYGLENPKLWLLIVLHKLFQLWPLEELSGWFLCPLEELPTFSEHSPTSCHNKMPYARLVFCFPSPESTTSLRNLGSFYGRMVFKNQIWVLDVLSCSWGVTASMPSQGPELGNVCTDTDPCLNADLFMCLFMIPVKELFMKVLPMSLQLSMH